MQVPELVVFKDPNEPGQIFKSKLKQANGGHQLKNCSIDYAVIWEA